MGGRVSPPQRNPAGELVEGVYRGCWLGRRELLQPPMVRDDERDQWGVCVIRMQAVMCGGHSRTRGLGGERTGYVPFLPSAAGFRGKT